MSGSISRILRSPTRTRAWSSAIRTRTSSDRQSDADREAAARPRDRHRAGRRRAPPVRACRPDRGRRPSPRCHPGRRRDLELERVRRRSGRCTRGARIAGVLERVRQRLLHDPVRRELDARPAARAARRRRRTRPGGRPRAAARPASARRRGPGCGASGSLRVAAQHAEQAAHLGERARGPICSIVSSDLAGRACRAAPAPAARHRPAATIIETWWAITSCSSRAIRARSSTTASRAARSRSRSASCARRSRSPTTRSDEEHHDDRRATANRHALLEGCTGPRPRRERPSITITKARPRSGAAASRP